MRNERKLKDRTIAVLATDGFEKVELTIPVRALKRAGARVDIVSLRRGRIRGVNLHMPAARVGVDKTISEADPGGYDGLLLPGGFINPDLLRQCAAARHFVESFASSGRPIATLCHGPWVLASAGLLQGRTLTAWPGIRDDLVNAGATWLDQASVRDGNLVTSRGPQDLAAFVPAMLDLFASPLAQRRNHANGHASDAPRDEPPSLAVAALRWLPKPSIVGALAGAIAATAALGVLRWRQLPNGARRVAFAKRIVRRPTQAST